MVYRIGIYTKNLSDYKPRGIARVAHAFIEVLSKNKSSLNEFEFLAIDKPEVSAMEVVFESEPIDVWYEKFLCIKNSSEKYINKLTKSKIRLRRLEKIKDLFRKKQWQIHPTLFTLAQYVHRKLKAYLSKSYSKNISSMNLPQNQMKYIGLAELDAVISFYAFEDFWDIPTDLMKNNATQIIGCFYDAAPLRLYSEAAVHKPFFNHFSKFTAQMASRADQIFCCSDSARDDIHYYFPSSINKTKTIYLGYDKNRFSQNSLKQKKIPKVDFSKELLLFLGGIESRKNIDGILKALIYLATVKKRKIQFVIAGETVTRRLHATMLTAAHQVCDIVEVGYLDDDEAAYLMSKASAFLYPSLWEGFGIPILEALALGVPVITSNISSMAEVGMDYVIGCNPYDSIDIARAIEDALSLKGAKREQFIERGKNYAENFSWEKMTQEFLQCIKKRDIHAQFLRSTNEISNCL